jgi:hypothetical protein
MNTKKKKKLFNKYFEKKNNIWPRVRGHVAKYGHVYVIRASIWTRVKYTRPIGHMYLKHVSSLLRVRNTCVQIDGCIFTRIQLDAWINTRVYGHV